MTPVRAAMAPTQKTRITCTVFAENLIFLKICQMGRPINMMLPRCGLVSACLHNRENRRGGVGGDKAGGGEMNGRKQLFVLDENADGAVGPEQLCFLVLADAFAPRCKGVPDIPSGGGGGTSALRLNRRR